MFLSCTARLIIGIALGGALATSSLAQTAGQSIDLRLVRLDGSTRDVSALLTRPGASGALPAVVLVPDGLGLDHRLALISSRLNAEGWATLQLNLEPFPGDGDARLHPNLLAMQADAAAIVADLAQVLSLLGDDPTIDSSRIAVFGLGTGGRAALLAGSEIAMSQELGTYGLRFAAHAAFYPGCDALKDEELAAPHPWSPAPVAAFHAAYDEQNTRSTCEVLADTLAVRRRPAALWHTYPSATYGWDFGPIISPGPVKFTSLGPRLVPVVADRNVAEDSVDRLVRFLSPVLQYRPSVERAAKRN